MRSNYRKIWDLIHLVDKRNKWLKVSLLLWLTIAKKFIPSVANIIWTDMENYKIIHKNQFACSLMQVRRDKKMPVALLQDFEEAIISQAYPIFEVNDEKELLPEYLMMWFTREEFDREACFYAVGWVRGSLEWEDFCNMKLPVPDITKQQEIVDEYNIIKNRLSLNNNLIEKLEETAKSIYKEWFVDFEFPDENGKPYKSSGGEMEFCSEFEKEVPKGWRYEKVNTIIEILSWYSFSSEDYGIEWQFWLVSIENVKDWLFIDKCKNNILNIKKNIPNHCFLQKWDLILSLTGNVGRIAIVYWKNFLLNQRVWKIKLINDNFYSFIYFLFRQEEFRNFLISISRWTAQLNLSPVEFQESKMIVPKIEVLINFDKDVKKIISQEVLLMEENSKLNNFLDLILSKMASES